MEQFPRETLRHWASVQPEILGLYVFGSRARGEAKPSSDLDLAVELDNSRESQLTVLIVNSARWKDELHVATGLVVKDLYLRGDEQVTGVVKEIYRRERR